MPKSPPAVVTPSALRWARESIGFTIEEAARRIGVSPERLERAEQGDHLLTMRQAEAAARYYDRPLAALFMPEPPTEEPVEAQFRRLPGAPPPPWPHEMRLLSRRVRERQAAAADLYEVLEEAPPWTELTLDFGEGADDPSRLVGAVRDVLGVPLDEQRAWQDRSGYKPLRAWVDAVESVGVLVMQDGTMPVDLLRGFASTDPQVPTIVVNSQDDPRARAFTAIHELGHLLRVRAGLPTGPYTEGWCDDLAGLVLMPSDAFAADFRRSPASDLLVQVDRVALTYGVTPHAAAVRASRLGLAPRDELDEAVERIRQRGAERSGGRAGGDYYRTKVSRLGPAFVGLVFAALDTQAVSDAVASGLLREKVNHLPTLRECLVVRR